MEVRIAGGPCTEEGGGTSQSAWSPDRQGKAGIESSAPATVPAERPSVQEAGDDGSHCKVHVALEPGGVVCDGAGHAFVAALAPADQSLLDIAAGLRCR